jgi:hypothetical protein
MKETEVVQGLVFIGIIVLVVVGIIFSQIAARKRRSAMLDVATRLGLNFDPDTNRDLPRRFGFMDKLREGSNRYAFNVLSGAHAGHDLILFDYHYQTGSGKNTQHHFLSFFVLRLPTFFPELTIQREGFFSKIAQAVGFEDIDFESHEFSRKFCVRSQDKKFAYDVCNARMIEYLLANPDLGIEIERDSLAIAFDRRLAPESIEPNVNRLIAVRTLMPDYLFSRS